MTREDVAFPSGDGSCAAWLYRPASGAADAPCVVMAHGFSLTRHDGLPAFAEALCAAGLAVLVFDHRHLGDSPGEPRQRYRVGLQREDWRSAVAFARGLAGVDPRRIVLWCYSIATVPALGLAVAAPGGIAAVLALCPFVDGLARALRTPPRLTAWILPRAIADAAGRPTTIPVTAEPGGRAAMTFPGEAAGFARSVPAGSPWRNAISPAVFLSVATLRPVTQAHRVPMPLWVGMGERDVTVHAPAVERLARDAPRGELHRYPYDHFEPLTPGPAERVAGDQVAFLRRLGLAAPA